MSKPSSITDPRRCNFYLSAPADLALDGLLLAWKKRGVVLSRSRAIDALILGLHQARTTAAVKGIGGEAELTALVANALKGNREG